MSASSAFSTFHVSHVAFSLPLVQLQVWQRHNISTMIKLIAKIFGLNTNGHQGKHLNDLCDLQNPLSSTTSWLVKYQNISKL